jgi:hypothetical protein
MWTLGEDQPVQYVIARAFTPKGYFSLGRTEFGLLLLVSQKFRLCHQLFFTFQREVEVLKKVAGHSWKDYW